jgi:hypothetical protein
VVLMKKMSTKSISFACVTCMLADSSVTCDWPTVKMQLIPETEHNSRQSRRAITIRATVIPQPRNNTSACKTSVLHLSWTALDQK